MQHFSTFLLSYFFFKAPLAVFILEDALSVQTDNASIAVFILRTHYPSGRTWVNICSLLVMRLKTGTRRIMRLDELSFEIRLERRTTKGSSSGRIMRLVPVFIPETHNLDELQNVCPSSSRRIMHLYNKNGHWVIIHLPKPFPSSKTFYFQNEAKLHKLLSSTDR